MCIINERMIASHVRGKGSIDAQGLHTLEYRATQFSTNDPWEFGKVSEPGDAYSERLQKVIDSAIRQKIISRGSDGLLSAVN